MGWEVYTFRLIEPSRYKNCTGVCIGVLVFIQYKVLEVVNGRNGR
jgi:hypothetical protein